MKNEKPTNCKNCGAPIRHLYTHKCEYCGTYLNMQQDIDHLTDLRDFKLVDVRAEFRPSITHNEYEFILKGIAVPKHQWLYEDGGAYRYCTFKNTDATPVAMRIPIDWDIYAQAGYSQEGLLKLREIIDMGIPTEIKDQPELQKAIHDEIYYKFLKRCAW